MLVSANCVATMTGIHCLQIGSNKSPGCVDVDCFDVSFIDCCSWCSVVGRSSCQHVCQLYTVRHKNTPEFIDCNNRNFKNNFWYEYSRHIWGSNDHLCSRHTEHLFLHYLGKTKQAKYYIFIQCSIII